MALCVRLCSICCDVNNRQSTQEAQLTPLLSWNDRFGCFPNRIMSGEPVPSPGSGRSARVTSQWNGKNLLPNPAEAGPGAENLPLISPLNVLIRNVNSIQK